MDPAVFLEVFDVNGRLRARVGRDGRLLHPIPKSSEAPPTKIVIEIGRLVVVAPAEQDRVLILDYLPKDAELPKLPVDSLPFTVSENELEITLAKPPAVDAVTFKGFVRCCLSSNEMLKLSGALKATNQSLAWQEFHAYPLNQAVVKFKPSKKLTDASQPPVTLTPTLLGAWFLRQVWKLNYNGEGTRLEFAAGPRPAPDITTTERLADNLAAPPNENTLVVRFRRKINILGQNGPFPAGAFQFDFDWPLSVTASQTHAALDRGGEPTAAHAKAVVRLEGLPSAPIFREYDRAAKAYLASLQTVQDGRPSSGLVLFDSKPVAASSWVLTFDLAERYPKGTLPKPDDLLRPPAFRAAFPSQPTKSLDPVPLNAASLPGLARHDFYRRPDATAGQPYPGVVELRCVVESPLANKDKEGILVVPDGLSDSIACGLAFRLRHRSGATDNPQWVRVGALDLGFPQAGDQNGDEFLRSVVALDWRGGRGAWAHPIPEVRLECHYRVARADVGGQDGLPSEPYDPTGGDGPVSEALRPFRREPALIIPVGVAPTPRPFTLRIRESTAAGQSQVLAMQLFERTDAPQPDKPAKSRDVIVLDRHPLLVARVTVPALAGIGGTDGIEVGNWSGAGFEGPSWELAGASEGFYLNFPPQAVGEGMEKRAGADVLPDKPSQFRLGPVSRFKLESSYFRQNFTEAVWNLRRILGYPGQRAPGAGVKELRFEMLYGLGCTVTGDGLRLAELAARLGNVPGPMPAQISQILPAKVDQHPAAATVYEAMTRQWGHQFAAYASRLGVLEPWTSARPGPLELTAGVDYLLRPPTDYMRNPTVPTDPQVGDPEHLKLAGGALWGFEFRAQYEPFERNPATRRSTAGRLSGAAFSALGGWGRQTAIFQNGLTTIFADTGMGRTSFYSVVRAGRINNCWNTADHVVIYERTVGTALQFRPWKKVDKQDHHAGRPLPRKVREFIRIKQKCRGFPDLGGGEVACGCVREVEFETLEIPVDGRWGHDIIDPSGKVLGYVIPLWNPDEDPVAFPKPKVAVRLAGAAAADERLTAFIEDPEKLMFFSVADVDPASGPLNTDTWDAVRGVDFPDAAWPKPAALEVPADGDLERPVADEAAVAPGYEQFTYTITPVKPANVIAGRADRGLGAVLRNVCFVRADPVAAAAEGASFALAAQEQMALGRAALAELQSLLAAPLEEPSVRAGIETLVKQAADVFQKTSGALTEVKLKLKQPRDWKTLTETALTKWQARAEAVVREELQTRLLAQLGDLPAELEAARRRAAALVQHAYDVLDLAAGQIDAGLNELLALMHRAAALPSELTRQLDAAAARLVAETERLLSAATLTDEVRRAIDALVLAAQRQLVEFLRAAVNPAADAVSRYCDVKVAAPLQTAVAIASEQLAEWRREVVKVLPGAADVILAKIKDLAATLSNVRKAIDAGLKPAVDLLGELQKRALALRALKLGNTPLQEFTDIPDRLKRLLTSIETAAQGQIFKLIEDDVKSLAARVTDLNDLGKLSGLDAFIAELGNLPGLLGEIKLDDITKAANELKDNVTEWLQKQPDLEELRRKVQGEIDKQRAAVEGVLNGITQPLAAKFPKGLVQAAGTVLRLARAFGDAPIVEGMGFNRQKLGYFYDPLKALAGVPIDISPAVALVNRVGGQLKALGVTLPTGKLLDQVLPPTDELLKSIDFGKILPDFAGIRLDRLLPDLKVPAGLKDRVKITHNVDKQAGRGWVQADVAIPVAGPTTLFDGGPLRVSLRKVDFTARIRIEAGLNGTPKHTQSGKLSADWDLGLGGKALVTFKDTALTFDESGQTKFSLDPTKVEMNGVLAMISKVVQAAGSDKSGFTLKIKDVGGVPVGVEAVLDLKLPDLAFGACSMANLRLGARLDLAAVPEFAISLGVNISAKASPFTLTVFILGGGGWFDARGRFLPLTGRLTTTVSIGLSAGAMLAIAFGPVKGCVFAFFYIEGELRTDSADPGGRSLTVRIGLLLGGEVDLCGLVTVAIRLLLELEYTGGNGALTGRGTLSLKIKICFFLTISVHMTAEKRFAGGSRAELVEADSNREAPFVTIERACRLHLSRTT